MSGGPDRRAPRPLAIALEYDGAAAPRVTAKGEGVMAERIIAVAREKGVAVEENAILAQALSAVELDDHIPQELYRSVAQVIAFVLNARRHLDGRGQEP
jgi:flagellar biosynthesis protein